MPFKSGKYETKCGCCCFFLMHAYFQLLPAIILVKFESSIIFPRSLTLFDSIVQLDFLILLLIDHFCFQPLQCQFIFHKNPFQKGTFVLNYPMYQININIELNINIKIGQMKSNYSFNRPKTNYFGDVEWQSKP